MVVRAGELHRLEVGKNPEERDRGSVEFREGSEKGEESIGLEERSGEGGSGRFESGGGDSEGDGEVEKSRVGLVEEVVVARGIFRGDQGFHDDGDGMRVGGDGGESTSWCLCFFLLQIR